MASLGGDSPKQIASVQLFLQYHANPRLKNRDGLTPLAYAKQNNAPGIVKVLEQAN
jgi:ankyrin repeat protein